MECWARRDRYDRELLANFFNYWSDVNPKTHKMRFEEEEYWDIDCRLPRWKNNSHTVADATAAIRLNKTKAKQTQEQQAEESKQTQMLTEEYVKTHPDSLMAKIYKKTKKSPSHRDG